VSFILEPYRELGLRSNVIDAPVEVSSP